MWFDLSLTQWLVLIGCSLLIGMAKAGIQGTGLMMVPIMAYVFGGRPSTGLVLPMLIFADIFAVRYYNRHAQWGHIFRLIPWAVVGVLVGVFVGARVSEAAFKTIMGIIIFIGIAVMIWRDLRKLESLPDRRWTAPLIGGLYLGIKIVKVIPEKAYRILVIVTTATAAAFLLR
jgi:uncharacterized membrane protein YfcA